jgi:hypothetical protein
MNIINIIYTLGLVAMYFIMGADFTFWVFIVSVLVALIPLAISSLFFAAPIVILIWCFFFGSDPYDSDFAWLCIIYAPFHYTSFISHIITIIRGVVGG